MARIKRRSGSAKEIAALKEQGIRNLSVSRESVPQANGLDNLQPVAGREPAADSSRDGLGLLFRIERALHNMRRRSR